MIQNNFIELDSKEMVFEKRLEKYLKWQSKYHLPFNETERQNGIFLKILTLSLILFITKYILELIKILEKIIQSMIIGKMKWKRSPAPNTRLTLCARVS